MSLDEAHVERLLAVARDAASGATFRERMAAIADDLGALVPHVSLAALPLSPGAPAGPPPPSRVYAEGAAAEIGDDYFPHYWQADPTGPFVLQADGAPRRLSDHVPDARWGKDAYTGEFLPRAGIRYNVGVSCRVTGDDLLVVGFHRDHALGDFDDHEVRLIRLLGPDLARAARGAWLREELAARTLAQHQVARPYAGTIVVAPDGELRHADPAALALAHEIERGAPGAFVEGLLADAAALARARPDGAGTDRVLPLDGGGWALVRTATLARGAEREAVCTLARVAPGTREHLEAEVQRARLTPRERQVALLAVRGLTYREIGQELQVTSSTIKQHLRCVYDKLDVTGRAELPGRLLGVDLTLAGT